MGLGLHVKWIPSELPLMGRTWNSNQSDYEGLNSVFVFDNTTTPTIKNPYTTQFFVCKHIFLLFLNFLSTEVIISGRNLRVEEWDKVECNHCTPLDMFNPIASHILPKRNSKHKPQMLRPNGTQTLWNHSSKWNRKQHGISLVRHFL